MTNDTNFFEKYFEECCISAYSDSVYETIKDDKKYIDACKRCTELFNQIEEKINDDGTLINEFDEAKNYALGYDDKYIYHQGVKDCIYLLRWMGVL